MGKIRKNGKEKRVKKNYGGRGNLENEEKKKLKLILPPEKIIFLIERKTSHTK